MTKIGHKCEKCTDSRHYTYVNYIIDLNNMIKKSTNKINKAYFNYRIDVCKRLLNSKSPTWDEHISSLGL
jgi:hypothetical protein